MSYTKEAVSDTPSAAPSAAPSVMREETVIDPYKRTSDRVALLNKTSTPVGQENKNVGTAAVETKPTEATVTLSPQVAALARRDQKVRHQEKAIKDREAALDAKLAKVSRLEALEAKLAAKDYSGLDDLVDYNEYSQYQVNKLNGSDPNQEALKKLSEEVTNLKKSQEESTSKLFEAAVSERRNAVNKLVDSNAEFASIKKLGMQEAVVQHILDTWEHDSEELSVEDAAKEVKTELLERAKRMASVLEPDAPASDEKKPLPPMKPGLKTLTNHVTAGESTKPAKSFQGMSDAERYAEARRRAEAKLQQTRG